MSRKSLQQALVHQPIISIFLLLFVTLTACGTLDISLEQTPEPVQTGSSTESGDVPDNEAENTITQFEITEQSTGWGSLESYLHPRYGYEFLVPENAEVLEPEPGGRLTSFSNIRPEGESPSYLIEVVVSPAKGQSTEEVLAVASSDESDVSPMRSVEMADGNLTGALVTYSFGPTPLCPEMRPLLAVVVEQDIAYLITVYSEEVGHCEAIHMPEALAIVNSFRPPTVAPILAMTPTPVSALAPTSTPVTAPVDDLVVVFTRDNNAWLWTENGGESQLTKNGGVDQVLLSDDKRVVAFRRGTGLWAVNTDGSNERQLVKESDIPIPQEGELADYITGMAINQLAWIPGSHELLFNTMMLSDGPGLLLSDDLWRVNANPQSALSLDYLFLPGEGGNFAIAPDGNQVAVITPDSISLTTINGEDRQRIFGYTPVATYSEVAYYAQPVWSPKSDLLGVVIPPPDPLGTENQAFGIWLLHADRGAAGLVGTIEARGTRPLPDPVINPTLETIAYLSNPEIESDRTDLLLVSWEDTIGDPIFYTSRVDGLYDWSPGGERFSFTQPPGETNTFSIFTGQLDEEPRQVGDGKSLVLNVHWLDDNSYLYLQASDRGWELFLNNSVGTDSLIVSVGGRPPAFDAVR